VSSTVASIVSNLQNVETPWKTQLTKLESQDTAISSLGTLFSTLSNDISSLTDFSGIMAEKEGSSSDQSVLTLTSATSSAVAGTHTVEIANLAQTSSGYLATIANSSDTLSGAVTLQVGSSGTSQTFTLSSSDNTLSGLASAINASGVGIDASVLTDANGSRLSLVSGTSGASGNIIVSANSIVDATSTTLSYTGSAGTSTANSTGTLSAVAGSSDALTGSISIAVGSNTAQTVVIGAAPSSPAANTIYTGSGVDTLSAVASAITSANIGVKASVVTNSDGTSSLSLESQTAGSAGTLTVNSSIVDPSTALAYTSTVTGANANLTVDGINLTSTSNTVANLIPGVTFQLLAPSAQESGGSLEQVQVVIANDNTQVESTVSQFVSDYNSLISAMNTQDGNDSSGNPEPLFGSPTLSLLQQQLLSGLNAQNPNGYLESITNDTGTTLTGSMSIAVGGGAKDTFIVGAGTNTANTFYTGTGVNTLAGLADAINAANSGTTLNYTGASGSLTGTLEAVSGSTALSGSLSVTVGSGTTENIVIGAAPSTGEAANTIYTGTGTGNFTLSNLADDINGASNLGVTAAVTTDSNGLATLTLTSSNGDALTASSSLLAAGPGVTATVITDGTQSTLSLLSQTAGSSGALAVDSSISATSDALLSYTGTAGTNSTDSSGNPTTTTSSGTMTSVAAKTDTLTGSISIQVGSGGAQTVTLSSSGGTLQDLVNAINATANIGVDATMSTDSKGLPCLALTSNTAGTDGTMTVTSSILDTTNPTTTNLTYTNSSDISTLANLGITLSSSDDGSLTFDTSSLDSVLNSDYSGVVGFFQSANGWGQTFSTILTNAGTSSATGALKLASTSNSSIESTLNADVSKEELLISAQQKSLTTELNSANEIMQEIPTELAGVNELYSAITGYDKNSS
jgi:flagellar hook-associated protein 2